MVSGMTSCRPHRLSPSITYKFLVALPSPRIQQPHKAACLQAQRCVRKHCYASSNGSGSPTISSGHEAIYPPTRCQDWMRSRHDAILPGLHPLPPQVDDLIYDVESLLFWLPPIAVSDAFILLLSGQRRCMTTDSGDGDGNETVVPWPRVRRLTELENPGKLKDPRRG
jgi:hypothetical protein